MGLFLQFADTLKFMLETFGFRLEGFPVFAKRVLFFGESLFKPTKICFPLFFFPLRINQN